MIRPIVEAPVPSQVAEQRGRAGRAAVSPMCLRWLPRCLLLLVANARIEQRIDELHQHHQHRDRDGDEEHDPVDHREVVGADRKVERRADAGQREDAFDARWPR